MVGVVGWEVRVGVSGNEAGGMGKGGFDEWD